MTRFGAAFGFHLRRERLRMLCLAFGVGLFAAVLVALSSSVRPPDVQEMLDKLPAAIRTMVGLQPGDVFDLARWVGLIHGHPVWLVIVLSFPLAAGLRGVAGGLDDGTLELVLAQPITRDTYYLSLAAVLVVGVTVVLSGSLAGALLARALVELPGVIPLSTLLELTVSGWALALSVAGITLLASVVCAGGGRPGSWAVGVVVVMFFLRFLADMVPAVHWLRWLSVFGYHDPHQVVSHGLGALDLSVLLAVGAVCAGLGLFAFRRKQLSF